MRVLRTAALAIAVGLAASGSAIAASVTLVGPTTNSGSYSSQDLENLANATPGSTVSSGGFTGISLWALLGGANAGAVVVNPDGSRTRTYGAITTVNPAGANTNPNF